MSTKDGGVHQYEEHRECTRLLWFTLLDWCPSLTVEAFCNNILTATACSLSMDAPVPLTDVQKRMLGDSAPPPPAKRCKTCTVKVYNKPRDLGVMPTAVFSDVHSTVQALTREVNGRGRPISLPASRAKAVEEALAMGGVYSSVEALRQAVREWRSEAAPFGGAASVNEYYDAQRARAYTERLGGAQETLALRCAELAGLIPARTDHQKRPLLLDVGCGSGLSMLPLEQRGCAMLGVDLSLEMLRTARESGLEVIQADMSHTLPFRNGVFDGLVSVSAVQFLCEAAAGRSARERLACCMQETQRVLETSAANANANKDAMANVPCAAFQFHPADQVLHPRAVLEAAEDAGCQAALVMDQPHRTSGRRWFLYLTNTRITDGQSPPCCGLYSPNRVACPLSLRAWTRQLGLPSPRLDDVHEDWLGAEHRRSARRLLRLFARQRGEDAQLLNDSERVWAERLSERFLAAGSEAPSSDDLRDQLGEVLLALHADDHS